MLMLKIYVPLYSHGKWGNINKPLTHGYQDFLFPDIFQNVMSKLVQDIEYAKTISYLVDLLMLENSSFKDHLLKLEMVLARLSTILFLV
jgi:hypothetical protein